MSRPTVTQRSSSSLAVVGSFAAICFGGFLLPQVARSAEWAEASVDFDIARLRAAAIAPTQPDRIFIGGLSGGFYRSEDGGSHWTNLSTHLPPSSSAGGIAVSPSDPDLVMTGSIQPGVLRSTDGGETWMSVTAGLDGERVFLLRFDPVDPQRVFAGTGSGSADGVYRSEDAGLTWTRTTTSFGDFLVLSLALDPSDPDRLIAGSLESYLRSTDGGDSWSLISPSSRFDSISWSSTDPSRVYAVNQVQAFRSTDGGLTFAPLPTPGEAYGFRGIAADPNNGNQVFLSGGVQCEFGLFDTGALFRSANGGTTWTQVFASDECSDFPAVILFDPGSPGTLHLAASGPRGFFTSTNTGTSWSVRNAGIHMYSAESMQVDGAGTVYVRSGDLTLRAEDISATWTELATPFYTEDRSFEASPSVPGLLYESGIGYVLDSGWPYSMASENGGDTWSPTLTEFPDGLPGSYASCLAAAWNSDRVYAFLPEGVFRSDDRNQSYIQVNPDTYCQAAAVDPGNPSRLVGSQRYDPSFQLSEDGGVTWVPRSAGLPIDDPVLVEFDPSDTDRIVVVFDDEGAWETFDAGLSWNSLLDVSSKIVSADWDPESGSLYVGTQSAGVFSNDPRLDSTGLPSNPIPAILYLDAEDAVVVGSYYHGIYVQHLDDPAATPPSPAALPGISLRAYPNPTRTDVRIDLQANSENGPDHGRITVYDAAGRQVRELFGGSVQTGVSSVRWDTRDDQGREVVAGVYWVKFQNADGEAASLPLTIVR